MYVLRRFGLPIRTCGSACEGKRYERSETNNLFEDRISRDDFN